MLQQQSSGTAIVESVKDGDSLSVLLSLLFGTAFAMLRTASSFGQGLVGARVDHAFSWLMPGSWRR